VIFRPSKYLRDLTQSSLEYGADVLLISCLRLPNLPMFEIDTTRGKRAAEVDLDHEEGMATMKQLIQNYDVLLQAYRRKSLPS
jgi:crotonobetainyl-CoA:carnitine CoA-transferase CaiB-like acyl-CoA transferase